MVKIALAGGNGGLGRTIAEALRNSEHEFIILTRAQHSTAPRTESSANIAVDYTDVEAISRILDEHQIHTVVSVLAVKTPEQRDAQVNLIRAAERASSVKRFTPSEFGTPRQNETRRPNDSSTDYNYAAVAELERTDLEYTLFSHGLFMDYYGMPKVHSNLTPWVFAIDIANKTAGIPGSGDVPAVYTYSGDVAKFVVAALGLPDGTWPRQSIMVGDRRTLNEVLRVAESVRGPFKVQYDPLQELEQGRITELPSHVSLYQQIPKEMFQQRFAGFGIAMERGAFDFEVPADGALLNDMFLDIRVKTVEELIIEAWAER